MSKTTRYEVYCDRMTTAERIASEMRQGVIVFDTDINSFFINNGLSWEEITNGGGAVDPANITFVSKKQIYLHLLVES